MEILARIIIIDVTYAFLVVIVMEILARIIIIDVTYAFLVEIKYLLNKKFINYKESNCKTHVITFGMILNTLFYLF
jgi:hypothetical protein